MEGTVSSLYDSEDPMVEQLIRHHGHLGGFAVLGYRAGELLMSVLSPQRYFGLNIVVYCPAQPPHSCLLDGLQLSTGCSTAKGNLHLRPSERVLIRAENTASGQRVWIAPAEGVLERILQLTKVTPEDAANWAWGHKPEELWVQVPASVPWSDAQPSGRVRSTA